MVLVGLTGGMGTGKSTVSAELRRLGAYVIDADALAREVVEPGSAALAQIERTFSSSVINRDGTLNRSALATIVFADSAALRSLESITHPAIQARTTDLLAAAPPGAVVIHDMPLLAEQNLATDYHLVITVEAELETRLARLRDGRGIGRDEALARMRVQADPSVRRAMSDIVLTNDASLDELNARVAELLDRRLSPLAANLASGHPARQTWADPGSTMSVMGSLTLARLRRHLPIEAHVRPPVDGSLVEVAITLGRGLDAATLAAVADGAGRASLVPLSAPGPGQRFGSADPARPATAVVEIADADARPDA